MVKRCLGIVCVLSGCSYEPPARDACGSFLETIMHIQSFQTSPKTFIGVPESGINVVEMNHTASIAFIAKNCESGLTTAWDAHFLRSIGLNLSEDEFTRIELGLTTKEDADALFDAALFGGVI